MENTENKNKMREKITWKHFYSKLDLHFNDTVRTAGTQAY